MQLVNNQTGLCIHVRVRLRPRKNPNRIILKKLVYVSDVPDYNKQAEIRDSVGGTLRRQELDWRYRQHEDTTYWGINFDG